MTATDTILYRHVICYHRRYTAYSRCDGNSAATGIADTSDSSSCLKPIRLGIIETSSNCCNIPTADDDIAATFPFTARLAATDTRAGTTSIPRMERARISATFCDNDTALYNNVAAITSLVPATDSCAASFARNRE